MAFKIKDGLTVGTKVVTSSAGVLDNPVALQSLTTNDTSFNLLNTNATTVTAFGAATTALSLGANGGTVSILNPTVTLTNATALNLNGTSPQIATTSATASIFNATVTTLNIGAAATAIAVGNNSGVLTLKGGLAFAGSSSGTVKFTAPATAGTQAYILPSTLAAGVLTSDVSGNLSWNSASNMVYPGAGIPNSTGSAWGTSYTTTGSGTTVALATSPTFTTSVLGGASFDVFNTGSTTVNAFGAATTVSIGATTGTASINNATVTLGNATTVNINGASPTLASSSTGTLTLFNTSLTTITAFNAATSMTLGSTANGQVVAASGTLTLRSGTTGTNTNVVLAPQGTGTVDVSSKRITSVADPSGAQDAATKAYVDATRSGLDVKDSVRIATTANIVTLSGLLVVDGVTLVAADRVLVKDQSTGSQNGIYVAAAGAWTRATDFDNTPGVEVTPGAFAFVEEGTTNADSGWVLTTNGTITIGTTALTFTQFSGAGSITAGNGLTKTGNTLDVGGTADRISVATDSIDIAATYVGQNTITTLGTIGTGTWQGTAVAGQYGGTGVNNSGKTITLGGNLTTSGAFTTTLTATANTAVTLPTTGTLATLNNTETFTGSKSFDSAILLSSSGTAHAAEQVSVYTNTVTTADTVLDTWSGATYRSCRYLIQVTQGTAYQLSELIVVHDGTNTYFTEYARLESGSELVTFNTNYVGGNINLRITQPSVTSATYKIRKSFIAV
jgi:hypothetical protein